MCERGENGVATYLFEPGEDSRMHAVDGSRGGGQLVRAAVSFAALTGDAVRVVDARKARDPPGLKAQHVAAINATANVCDADVDGVEVGSTSFEFEPDEPRADDYSIDIGTAGSIMLVLDAVLPVAVTLDEPLELTVTGGTDVEWAPTADYYRYVKLPTLREFGVEASLTVEQRGFYPAGGGQATLRVEPSSLSPIDLTERGRLRRVEIRSTASTSLEDASVADRQATSALQHLPNDVESDTVVEYVDSRSPGSVIDAIAEFEDARAGFPIVGKRGKPAEEVGTDAVADLAGFRVSDAAIDRYLADQLLPFIALAGGRVRIPTQTNHVETQAELLRQFGYDVTLDTEDGVLLSSTGERNPA